MTKVKFCGLWRDEDVEYANRLLPDYVGFVFAQKSKRFVTPNRAAELKSKLDTRISAVGVFVDEDVNNVARLLSDNVIDIAQLHGNETDDYISRLRELVDAPIIRAFRVREEQDAVIAACSTADMVLLDAPTPGSGVSFDWAMIKEIDRPYFLAGGLNMDNIGQAIDSLCPYAVDVSSGIELCGVKNFEKMNKFINTVRERNELQ